MLPETTVSHGIYTTFPLICLLQRFVRSVLCTRIAVPPVDSVSNRVLRAVLRGDEEALSEAVKRKRLKGVSVALTADDRHVHG